MSTISSDDFSKALKVLLDETFFNVRVIYLDKGTSLFETLPDITAEQASIPVGGKCATLAAQVKHMAFYLDVLEKGVREQKFPKVDWGDIWRNVNTVTPEEWIGIQDELKESYDRILKLIDDTKSWGEMEMIGAMSVIAHNAYHLGEIRQALCTIR